MVVQYDTVRVDVLEEGTLLRIVLDRPKGNVLSAQMMGEITAALRHHQRDPRLRMILLRGAGGHFSFGASVEEHRKAQAPEMLRTFHELCRTVAASPLPVAALVEGRCLGGAFELILCCHFVLATPTARFGCPEIRLGVFPPVLAAIGAQRLGSALAERLLLTGAELDAGAADRAGLLSMLVAGDADPEAAALEWYRATLRPLSAFALRQAALAARRGSGLVDRLGAPLDAVERQYVTALLDSHDGNEGIEAFLAKRPPVWRDE
jgi:cyclohexa-1,5-dienecarbonyl-CoA hydratase